LDGLAFHTLPHSYRENSAKEEAVLEYVENFRRQFVLLFPARRELMLCPVNECGVRKFVCSTIRPSKLANDEIYDLQSAANFVADFFEYTMLENPTQMPDLLPSPGSIVKLRAGDCYDLSHVLVTMLRGSGYDAYVVSGYAPLWITRADQSKVCAGGQVVMDSISDQDQDTPCLASYTSGGSSFACYMWISLRVFDQAVAGGL
jgi:hypothetical protein